MSPLVTCTQVVAQLKAIIDKRLKALRDGDDDDDDMDEIDDGEEEHPQRFMTPGGGDDGHGGDATDDADFTVRWRGAGWAACGAQGGCTACGA